MEPEKFEIESYKGKLIVETMNLPGQVLFKVFFPDNTRPVVICRATNFNQAKFWTSVPEGRQIEAEAIGPLIEQYFRTKQK
jgi:hypothetical protein